MSGERVAAIAAVAGSIAAVALMAAPAAGPWRFGSPAIPPGRAIPARFTCQGAGVSPPLSWGPPPAGTRALALVVRDRTARDFTHWLIWNLAPSQRGLPAEVPARSEAEGGRQGTNSFGRIGYGGPCPPPGDGPHQYWFTLYALDTRLGLPAGAEQGDLMAAMAGHVLAQASFYGTFQR